jgi:NADH dehydrogenase
MLSTTRIAPSPLRLVPHRFTNNLVRPSWHARQLATKSQPVRPVFYRTRLALRYTGYIVASSVVGLSVLTGAVFLHDAFTYTDKHVDRVPVSPLALHPQRGGPKNLPVVSAFLSDEEDPENASLAHKPRLVVVGGGWGVCPLPSGHYLVFES